MITSSIPKGKIPYRKQAELYVEFSATAQDTNTEVSVILDDRVLIMQHLETSITKLTHKFDDEPGQHELRIVLQGKPSGAMLHIRKIQIEGLNLRLTLEDSGTCIMDNLEHVPSEYMGQVGYQSLKFTTPIYPWLFENERKDDYYL